MTPEEARLELDATTLRPQDASAEARAMAESDPQLGAWLAKRTEFDERVADAMADLVPIPGDLHMKLLAMSAQPVPTMAKRKPLPRMVVWLAAAAVVLIMGLQFLPATVDWKTDALTQVQRVEHEELKLKHWSPDIEELKKRLIAEGSLSPKSLPDSMLQAKTWGCRTVQVAGKPATIICFDLGNNKEVHLVVMNAADLKDAPPQKSPVFDIKEGWATAAWSDGTQSFMLATSAGADLLRKFFT